ncbi:Putative antitoxin RelB2 [Methanocaldococcus lauensis]|uniref:Antitoxin RelB2 n=1 Tax=Methanocaldococcus lauensis TaxID=2546128 RepID=A0A8D6PY60_9EURY|nr:MULTISPECIES: antitoxin [Methanocaldococcus]MCQ6253857.1 antitoxin [Methanocaldococcus sp.]CAB3288052.1 Putative antitoxin RelB2 [Methanocaldococcus lauensis]CAB3288781.1 Putative antitoxin RelB2 [Methanocaldococcus lauensis]
MGIVQSYITDEKGNIKGVIVDYKIFKKIEELLLDYGLLKAMEEVEDEEEIDLETAKKLLE